MFRIVKVYVVSLNMKATNCGFPMLTVHNDIRVFDRILDG